MAEQGDAQKRQRTFRVEAVVMRHLDWGEADRLLWLFSRERGKLRAVAKGVRKPRSRKAGHLEPFTRVKLLLARGRDIPIVTQAEAVHIFLPVQSDLLGPTYIAYVVELTDRFTYEGEENPALYRLLVRTLERLSNHPDPDMVVRYYEMRLLDLVGFRPQLFSCVVCEREIQPVDQYFSAAQGGVLCPNCGPQVSGALPISLPALKFLRHFQRSRFEEAARASPEYKVSREMEITMQHYLTYVLERGLNTPAFLRRARRADMEVDPDPSGMVE